MPAKLSERRLRRLDVQGFDSVSEDLLAEVAPWLRLAYALCATLAWVGTALASVPLLLVLCGIAVAAAVSPVHPFDAIYNSGIRRMTGTPRLPERGAPARFACGVGSVWLLVTAWAFASGHAGPGYALGFMMAGLATLVASTDVCVPSVLFRAVTRRPPSRKRPGGIHTEGAAVGGPDRIR